MTRSMWLLLVALMTVACGQSVQAPVVPVRPALTVVESKPESVEEAPFPVCSEPCEASCLDEADAASNSTVATQLAAQACDMEACGYIGTAMQLRCKDYGFLKDAPVVGPVSP